MHWTGSLERNIDQNAKNVLTLSGQRIAKGAGGKGPRQKKSKIVKKCQKVFRHFSTIFAQGKKKSKIVKKCQKYFRHFLTIFARHQFSRPFWEALIRTHSTTTRDRKIAISGKLRCFSREFLFLSLLVQGKKEYAPPPRDPPFLGLSPDPEVTEQKKLWCIPFSWENKGKGYTP